MSFYVSLFSGAASMAKILLIDDSIFTLHHYYDLLLKMGHEVITADNGQEGIQQFQCFKPDIVFCDLMMPDMDGFEVLEIILKLGQTTKFIFLTADVQNDTRAKAKQRGAQELLEKPLTEERLSEVLRKYGV